MKFWQKKGLALASAVTLLLVVVATAVAQDTETRGKLSGAVYVDVNGDGICVGTGVEGEVPVAGVEIVFVSSDKATVVSLTTAENGTYGLAAAGQSIWEVTARPDASKWIVTSKNPLYVPVLPDPGLVQSDVNFCVTQGSSQGTNATIILPQNAVVLLPQSGAAAQSNGQTAVMLTAVLGVLIVVVGAVLEWRRRTSSNLK
ncbi:MAG: hypothetical protein HC804_00345 [Anaerolineae bacterium]|nr:hypothetical protein [Anaerolineae bacterium]